MLKLAVFVSLVKLQMVTDVNIIFTKGILFTEVPLAAPSVQTLKCIGGNYPTRLHGVYLKRETILVGETLHQHSRTIYFISCTNFADMEFTNLFL